MRVWVRVSYGGLQEVHLYVMGRGREPPDEDCEGVLRFWKKSDIINAFS